MAKRRKPDLHEFTERFGQRLASLREDKGWTQEALAERLGVGSTWVAKLEIGAARPSFKLTHNLANTLDVPVRELFNVDESDEWRGTEWEQSARQFRRHLERLGAKDGLAPIWWTPDMRRDNRLAGVHNEKEAQEEEKNIFTRIQG